MLNTDTAIIVEGPSKLSGTISPQGAKNSAMKHILLPLLLNGIYRIDNIPKIGSVTNLLTVINSQGGSYKWIDKNSLKIDTTEIDYPQPITKEQFYYTSGGFQAIAIIAGRHGYCQVELDPSRDDRGGDKIGGRSQDELIQNMKDFGYTYQISQKHITFKKLDNQPFNYTVPVRSFSATINAVFCALFRDGTSIIKKPTTVAEFFDVIKFLQKMGADIDILKNEIKIHGPAQLSPTNYCNMNDRHDVATWISATLTTNSKLKITDIDLEGMRLVPIVELLKAMNANHQLESDSITVFPTDQLKPVDIVAGMSPLLITEAQVIFSPVLTRINGQSSVVDTVFTNRMRHWEQLANMGAKYKYYQHPKWPEVDGHPRAVKVTGPVKLTGAEVTATDVRTGAALLIAALAAEGKSVINNADHIDRGYEDIVSRLRSVGANVNRITND